MKGNLYLFPLPLGGNDINEVLPAYVVSNLNMVEYFIVENVRTARRFLSKAGILRAINTLTFYEIDKHARENEMSNFLQPALSGNNIGLMSEAGCPAVADPGAAIVAMAHQKGIKVIPFTGPSSILLALMASGMNGQNFAFNGYIPVKKPEKIKRIKALELQSKNEKQTQIFIETPYRNMQLLEDIISVCHPATRLCIAVNVTLSDEFIKTKTIAEWKNSIPQIHKQTAVFLLYAG